MAWLPAAIGAVSTGVGVVNSLGDPSKSRTTDQIYINRNTGQKQKWNLSDYNDNKIKDSNWIPIDQYDLEQKQAARQAKLDTQLGGLEDEYKKATSGLEDYEKTLYDEYLRLTEPSLHQSLAQRGLVGSRVEADTSSELKNRAATSAATGKYSLQQQIFNQKQALANLAMSNYATGSTFDTNAANLALNSANANRSQMNLQNNINATGQANLFSNLANLALYSSMLGTNKKTGSSGTDSGGYSITGVPKANTSYANAGGETGPSSEDLANGFWVPSF